MKTKSMIIAAGTALAAMFAVAAQAAPMAPVSGAPDSAGTLIEKVHGCHRDVQWDRYGPHYHRGPRCERIDVDRPRHEERYQRDEPVCRQECYYIGPIKKCDTRCR